MDLPNFLVKAGGAGPQAVRASSYVTAELQKVAQISVPPLRQCVPVQTDK